MGGHLAVSHPLHHFRIKGHFPFSFSTSIAVSLVTALMSFSDEYLARQVTCCPNTQRWFFFFFFCGDCVQGQCPQGASSQETCSIRRQLLPLLSVTSLQHRTRDVCGGEFPLTACQQASESEEHCEVSYGAGGRGQQQG